MVQIQLKSVQHSQSSSHQGRANETTVGFYFGPSEWPKSRKQVTAPIVKDVEEREYSPITVGSAKLYSQYGNQHDSSLRKSSFRGHILFYNFESGYSFIRPTGPLCIYYAISSCVFMGFFFVFPVFFICIYDFYLFVLSYSNLFCYILS